MTKADAPPCGFQIHAACTRAKTCLVGGLSLIVVQIQVLHLVTADNSPSVAQFWDKQANDEGWVGLNYGLLTKWPGRYLVNQLEEKVITKLCSDEHSRNMNISLSKPDEATVQVPCTSGIQFVRTTANALNLVVSQRSSDIIVGLPFDVVVWTALLHLVCREVARRSQGDVQLAAGELKFDFAHLHLYEKNRRAADTLLSRSPIKRTAAVLEIAQHAPDLMNIEPGHLSVRGYGEGDAHAPIPLAQAL